MPSSLCTTHTPVNTSTFTESVYRELTLVSNWPISCLEDSCLWSELSHQIRPSRSEFKTLKLPSLKAERHTRCPFFFSACTGGHIGDNPAFKSAYKSIHPSVCKPKCCICIVKWTTMKLLVTESLSCFISGWFICCH